MINAKTTTGILLSTLIFTGSYASLITTPPGPDDQGGMLMPMVMIESTSGGEMNPSSGIVHADYHSSDIPVLRSLNQWSPGNWFATDAAWRADISPLPGTVSGMPEANSGAGNIFNSQYGFMFMGMGMPGSAFIPEGASLGIRLVSRSSSDLQAFNFSSAANRWDEVFSEIGDQVLWNGSMWHPYFTLPGNTPAGTYTVEFEIFIADLLFSGDTGFVQYDNAALTASPLAEFSPALITLTFNVVPEPALFAAILAIGLLGGTLLLKRNLRRNGHETQI